MNNNEPEFRSVDQVLIWADGNRRRIERKLEWLDDEAVRQWRSMPRATLGMVIRPQWYHIGPYRKKIRSAWDERWNIYCQQRFVKYALDRYDHPIRLNRVVDGMRFVKLYGGSADQRIMQIPLAMSNLRIPVMPKLKARVATSDELTNCVPLDIDFDEYELKIRFNAVMRTYEERMVLR